MSNELIERLAREAGLLLPSVPASDTRRMVIPVAPGMRTEGAAAARFAALVAEECAQATLALTNEAEREAGSVAAGMLEKAVEAMRAAFPMPKE